MKTMTKSMVDMPSPSLPPYLLSILAKWMYINSMLTFVNTFLPRRVQLWLYTILRRRLLFFIRSTEYLTVTINEFPGGGSLYSRNELYEAAEIYLPTKISSETNNISISKTANDKNINVTFNDGEVISDEFRGVKVKWSFYQSKQASKTQIYKIDISSGQSGNSFRLKFDKKNKNVIMDSYIPYMIETAKQMRVGERVLKIHTIDNNGVYRDGKKWKSVNLDHPSSFDTLAMEPSMKKSILEDLRRFQGRKDYYKRVGRAWKRGYLLYGPPGTGKSSLIAAMANYLKFDIYDLQLTAIRSDSDLRTALLETANRSILVIEDIDCSGKLPDRNNTKKATVTEGSTGNKEKHGPMISLAGLLNFIDGLWSSCGDERVIVFTTNHKKKLNPALLRPGRMDMHIHLSYCSKRVFEELAKNYLGMDVENHRLYAEIGELIDDDDAKLTPAKVTGKLMESEDPDVALDALLNLLKKTKKEKKMKEEEKESVVTANDEADINKEVEELL
ncbi:AAA-ATPase At5g17740 [Linum grandiflorum]